MMETSNVQGAIQKIAIKEYSILLYLKSKKQKKKENCSGSGKELINGTNRN